MTSRRTSLEEKLRTIEQRLRMALSASGMGTWEWDLRSNVVRWSPEVRQVIGVSEFDGTWDGFTRLVHPADLPRVRAAVVRAIETHTNYSCEFRVPLPDGTVRWIADFGRAVYDAHQRPIRMFGTFQDVTERYAAEERLRERDERLELAFKATGIGVWEWTVGTNDIYWSPECFSILGLGGYRARLEDFTNAVHPEDRAPVMAAAEAALAEGTEYHAEFRVIRPDGEARWISNLGRGVYDDDGRPLRLIGIMRDITEEHRARAALREHEERLRLALEGTLTGVFERDLLSGQVILSREGYDIFGVDTFEGTAEAFRQLVHPDDLAATQAAVEAGTARRALVEVDFRIRRPNGEFRWIRQISRTRYAEDGRPLRILGTLRDITEQRLAADRAAREEARLRLALSATRTGVWERDLLTDAMTWSPEVHAVFGVPELDGAASSFLHLVHPDDRRAFEAALEDAVSSGRMFQACFRILRPDCEVRWIESLAGVQYDATGRPIRLVGTVRDVTPEQRGAAAGPSAAEVERCESATQPLSRP